MLHFSDCRDARDPSVYVVVAQVNQHVTGSVAVKEFPDGDISVARLFTVPGWRRQGIARQMMLRVLQLYPAADVWLYAGPFTRNGERPGADADALRWFYRSLGFMTVFDGDGNPAMVRRSKDAIRS